MGLTKLNYIAACTVYKFYSSKKSDFELKTRLNSGEWEKMIKNGQVSVTQTVVEALEKEGWSRYFLTQGNGAIFMDFNKCKAGDIVLANTLFFDTMKNYRISI